MSWEVEHFHIVDLSVIDMETQSGAHDMPPLVATGTRVDIEEVVALVAHHFQNMGMAAHENVRADSLNQFSGSQVVVAGAASNVGHQDSQPFALEFNVLRAFAADVLAVAVAADPPEGLEGGNAAAEFLSAAKVPGVPEFVHRGKEIPYLPGEHSVRV